MWEAHREETDLAAAVTLAWLLWRAADAELDEWVARGKALAAQVAGGTGRSGRWIAGVSTLLADLAGDWATAQREYLALDRPVGAALAACRLGDRLFGQGDVAEALGLYDEAAAIWEQENDACGLALARYRQAEAYAQNGDGAASQVALQEAESLLKAAQFASQDDGHAVQQELDAVQQALDAVQQALDAVQQALDAVQQDLIAMDADPPEAWPSWSWQRYDDAFRISLLFRPQPVVEIANWYLLNKVGKRGGLRAARRLQTPSPPIY